MSTAIFVQYNVERANFESRGRSVLPVNFNFIVLDKKAITKLHSLGIDYQQERIRGGQNVVEIGEMGE